MPGSHVQRVSIGSLGTIGLKVAEVLDRGEIPGLALGAVSARDVEKAERNMAGFASPAPVVPLAELAEHGDIVLECAPASVFDEIARSAVAAGRVFVPCSVGALLPRMDLVDEAERTGGRIVVPTGALLGLDAVRGAAEGEIYSVTLETRKPPRGLEGAPYLVENAISVDRLNEAKKVFQGTAREAAKGFPANVNVAAALSLAGLGPDRTMVEIWADPAVDRNTHTIRLDSDSVRLTMKIENIPTEENPKTGKLTALSVIATLRGLVCTLKAGT